MRKEMADQPIKVLLVEDDPEQAHLLREMLNIGQMAPLQVEHVDCLSTALKRLAQVDIDVILLDLSLPDSWGCDTFTRVHVQAPDVPIVVLSGLSAENPTVRAVQEGAQDYLIKGQVDVNLLMRAIRRATEPEWAIWEDEKPPRFDRQRR
jgi:two-component system cell cycle sensor histidine kinase/response regulator CckA